MNQPALEESKQMKTYYFGTIKIKLPDFNDYQQFYVQLRAGELVLFENKDKAKRHHEHIEDKVSLKNVTKVEKWKRFSVFGNKQKIYPILLTFKNGEKIKIETSDKKEEGSWFRYLCAVALMKLPDETQNLLPGQTIELSNIIEEMKENKNDDTASSDIYDEIETTDETQLLESKDWFINQIISRKEAEKILEETNNFHNMILRKRKKQNHHDSWEYAVSVGPYEHGQRFRHFLVRQELNEYFISLDNEKHPKLTTLESIVDFFVTKSSGQYKPFQKTLSRNVIEEDTASKSTKSFGETSIYTDMKGNQKSMGLNETRVPSVNSDTDIEEDKNEAGISEPVVEVTVADEQLSISSHSSSHSWFINRPTSRAEAEQILEENQEFGNMILSESMQDNEAESWNYIVSVRPLNQENKFIHFPVRKNETENETEYFILLEDKTHPRLFTLESVIEYFIKDCSGEYKPLQRNPSLPESLYDFTIGCSLTVAEQ